DSAGLLAAQIQTFQQDWASYKQARDSLTLAASSSGNTAQAVAAATGPVDERLTAVENSLDALSQASRDAGQQRDLENDATFVQARTVILAVSGVALLAGLVIAVFLARRIAGNLGVVDRAAHALEANDLAQRALVHTGDEIETLANSFNGMAE